MSQLAVAITSILEITMYYKNTLITVISTFTMR